MLYEFPYAFFVVMRTTLTTIRKNLQAEGATQKIKRAEDDMPKTKTTAKEEFQATVDTNLKQFDELKEKFSLEKSEELHPDLIEHIDEAGPLGAFLKHPVIFFAHYDEVFNAQINAMYKQKKKQTTQALKVKDWTHWVWLHERPYRLDAFMLICKDMDSAEYWNLLKNVWVDAEFPGINQDIWIQLFTRKYPKRRKIMNGKERRTLAMLPKTNIDIFRGYHGDQYQKGISWTISYETAQWFAKRFAGDDATEETLVAEAVCNKKDVLAYFNEREESEIIIDPSNITIRRAQPA